MSVETKRLKAVQMLVLCTIFWAVSFPTMKALTMTQQPLVPAAGTWFFTGLGVMYRFGAAALVMLFLAWPTLSHLTRLECEQGAGLALFGAGGILFQMDGLAHTSASTSAFLTQCYCIFIPLWVAWRERRWPALKTVICCLMVITGVGVLAGVNWQTFQLGRGELETIAASILFTGQILWLERPHYAGNNVKHFSFVMFALMAVLAAPLAWVTAPQPSDWLRAYQSPAALGFLAILVFLSTLGGYLIMNYWQRHVTATEAGLIYCAEPVFASLSALILPAFFSRWAGIHYPDETVTITLLVGGGLITAANILVQMPSSFPFASLRKKPGPAAG